MKQVTDNREQGTGNRVQGMGNRLQVIVILFVFCSFIFTACINPLFPEPELPPGMGSFIISIDGDKIGRTVFPNLQPQDIHLYRLKFSYAGMPGDPIIEERTHAGLSSDPVIIEARLWDLEVEAFFINGSDEYLVAKSNSQTITIAEGANLPVNIILNAILDEGAGIFRWNIIFDNLPNNAGFDPSTINVKLEMEPWITGTGITFTDPIELYNAVAGTPIPDLSGVINDIDTGIYQLELELTMEGKEPIHFYDIVYIYKNLESVFTITFTQAHFNNRVHIVTYVLGNGQPNLMFSVMDGRAITANERPQNPTRDGFTFDGWENSPGNIWNWNIPLISDLTLTAKWLDNNFRIEDPIIYDPIVDGIPNDIPYTVILFRIPEFGITEHEFRVGNQYTNIRWYLNNELFNLAETQEGDITIFTLDQSEIDVTGTHFLTVEVILDGVPYSRTIEVKVIEE